MDTTQLKPGATVWFFRLKVPRVDSPLTLPQVPESATVLAAADKAGNVRIQLTSDARFSYRAEPGELFATVWEAFMAAKRFALKTSDEISEWLAKTVLVQKKEEAIEQELNSKICLSELIDYLRTRAHTTLGDGVGALNHPSYQGNYDEWELADVNAVLTFYPHTEDYRGWELLLDGQKSLDREADYQGDTLAELLAVLKILEGGEA